MLQRRGLLLGLLAAPAIIRTPGLLMPVRPAMNGRWGPGLYRSVAEMIDGEPSEAARLGVITREVRWKPLQLSTHGIRGNDALLGNEELLYGQLEYREVDVLGRVITDWKAEPVPMPVPGAAKSWEPRRSRYTNKGVRPA